MATTPRRTFLQGGTVLAASLLGRRAFAAASGRARYTAAVIGHTGHGDYGHGLDTLFNGLDNVTVAAIADANEKGLQAAQQRSGAQRAYLDYREMLEKEQPDLVSIAPRHPHEHRDMAQAAIAVGAHLYIEKPLTAFPAPADDILQAAHDKGVKISVAHTRRYADEFLAMKKLIDNGDIGDVLTVRFQGKQDSRVGGEDLIVLGSHDMDMMRFFFGDPLWCFASVTAHGQDITAADVRQGREPYTVAGDTVRADYLFNNNIQCRWVSIKAGGDWNTHYPYRGHRVTKWGFDIFGSRKLIAFQESIGTFVLNHPFIAASGAGSAWTPINEAVSISKPNHLSHPIRNLIHAIENDAKPQCSGEDARWAVEMCTAPYHSQKAGAGRRCP